MQLHIFKKELLKIYNDYDAVYGPTVHTDSGRIQYSLRKFKNGDIPGKNKTILLARAKLEIKLGRQLTTQEQADHIDENNKNDVDENIQLLTKDENLKKTAEFSHNNARVWKHCTECAKYFELSLHQRRVKEIEKGLHFCSKSCLGQYSMRNRWKNKG